MLKTWRIPLWLATVLAGFMVGALLGMILTGTLFSTPTTGNWHALGEKKTVSPPSKLPSPTEGEILKLRRGAFVRAEELYVLVADATPTALAAINRKFQTELLNKGDDWGHIVQIVPTHHPRWEEACEEFFRVSAK